MFHKFTGLRANLADLGQPDIDIYVIPETDAAGHDFNGAYLSHRDSDSRWFMFGGLQSIEEIAKLAYDIAPRYIPDFLDSVEEFE